MGIRKKTSYFAVDKTGEVIAHMIYDPWGNPQAETYTDTNYSGLDNLNNYTGYSWDEALGLYYAQNRFYDAADHRFTQEDIVKDGSNWYTYCNNNPPNFVDLNGLKNDVLVPLRETVEAAGGRITSYSLEDISIRNKYRNAIAYRHKATVVVGSKSKNFVVYDIQSKNRTGYFQRAGYCLNDNRLMGGKMYVSWRALYPLIIDSSKFQEQYRACLSVIFGFLPFVGDMKDAQECIIGTDFIAGKKLTGLDRAASGMAMAMFVPFVSGSTIRVALNNVKLTKYIEKCDAVYKGGLNSLSKPSSKALRQNMIDAGVEVPEYANAAHHIVAGSSPKAAEARTILQKYGIDINDAENGVFLPMVKDVAEGAYHPSLHTNAYYDEVNNLLSDVTSKQEALDVLKYISESLSDGTFMK